MKYEVVLWVSPTYDFIRISCPLWSKLEDTKAIIILDSRYKVTVIEWPLWCFPLPTDTDTELSRTLGPHGLHIRVTSYMSAIASEITDNWSWGGGGGGGGVRLRFSIGYPWLRKFWLKTYPWLRRISWLWAHSYVILRNFCPNFPLLTEIFRKKRP